MLNGLDRHEFNRSTFWQLHTGGHYGPPEYEPGGWV
jgi:hypothetical protein